MGSDGEMQEVAAGPASAPVKARRSGTSSRFLAAGAILAVAIAFLIYNGMQGAGAFYMTVEELQNTENITEGKQIRVGGNVVAGTIKQAGIGEEMYFEISDGVASVAIVYDGAPPDIFADHAEVIATGTMSPDGTFHATELLTKCPSRFEAADETV
jgi:cytochrome c-type biogenesis protein CcmE